MHTESTSPINPLELAAQVRRLADLQELRAIIDCYGAGHDLIFRDLGGDHREALDVLRRAHRDDLITNVFLFDEATPAQRLTSLTAFVDFVDGFARQNGYASARNVPGNVQITFTGRDAARITSSTAAPHFGTRPAIDLVLARYVDTAQRDGDGRWRTVARDLIVQQIWRGEGAYPFAAP
ncbi:MAG TPA: nuclear transport factor 2 family protein [Kofleriaceae bacterium]|nr:nuclear transport factor 2 family protein [Kofleriaceae bacterium]